MAESDYLATVQRILRELGIPEEYGSARGLALQTVATELVAVEKDIFGRAQSLSPAAADLWKEMKRAATEDGMELLLVSAFRSLDYQKELILRKLTRGLRIEEILRSNAAPGYSEHHTGRAVDITTPGSEPLTEAFEDTPACQWLKKNAGRFGFHLSYGRDNPHKIVYEPWHWLCRA
jgi:zinc D-Ala-D-Ala carboxypeptidase